MTSILLSIVHFDDRRGRPPWYGGEERGGFSVNVHDLIWFGGQCKCTTCNFRTMLNLVPHVTCRHLRVLALQVMVAKTNELNG